VLRGLHYQIQQAQGKLVRVVAGSVFDVAVDIRRLAHVRQVGRRRLSAENKRQMWVPPGFAHGFVVTSESAEFLYKTTDYWAPEHERSILWNDPELGIDWPLDGAPSLSAKDQPGKPAGRRGGVRMKILLTGATGQVGYELERSLQGLGEVVAVDRAAWTWPTWTRCAA
jgi:dTDP-4-dehydrorhamnose 3,5-epimerase